MERISRVPVIVVALVFFIPGALAFAPQSARSQGSSSFTGFAWSDTIGWVSMNCSDLGTCGSVDYGISVAVDGTLSGYAWSEHIGWISANASDLAGCPAAPCEARIEDGALTGWLKALAGGTSQSGGWDGWISLSGANYGPTLDDDGEFSGYAWGDTVVGWLSFSTVYSSVETDYEPCVAAYFCNGQTIVYTSPQCVVTDLETCIAPRFCSPGISTCLAPSPSFESGNGFSGHLEIRPRLVRQGETANVHWNLSDVQSCTVTGENGDEWTGAYSGAEGRETSPITEQTAYTLRCIALEGAIPSTIEETAFVSVVPEWTER